MEELKGVPYYYKQWTSETGAPYWIVYRKSDDKAGKCHKWFHPNLKAMFDEKEIEDAKSK